MQSEATARALTQIEPADAYAIFTGGAAKMDPILNLIRAQVDAFKGDAAHTVETEEGREAIRGFAYRITRSKTYLDEAGKELTDKAKEIPKKIDATRKHARDTLDSWRDEVRAPLTAWEAAEAERVERIKINLGELQALIDDQAERTAEVMRDRLGEVERDDYSETRFGEYAGAAIELRDAAIKRLNERIAIATQREKDAAELAELRKMRDAKEAEDAKVAAAERDERIRQEGIRAAEAKAAQEREAAAQREADLKRQAEEAEARAATAATKAAADAKAALEAQQQREADERAARERDVEHKKTINREALAALVAAGIADKTARKVIELIARGQVPNVSIAY